LTGASYSADPTRNLKESRRISTTYLPRIIGHLDLDYFYAQVEEIENSSLRKIPVIVCVYSGRSEDSGVVSTANYKAREYGVRSGMPIVVAKRKLAGIETVFLPVKHEKYEQVSERVMELIKPRVDILEQTSIDEAFFDITGVSREDFDSAVALARSIKQVILQEVGLSCTIGIAQNKVVAKMASDFKKPDGLTLVKPDEFKNFSSGLPVDKLYGVGTKTVEILRESEIRTIGELADAKLELLEELFGKKLAHYFHLASNGVDEEPVVERGEATQISRIITLKQNSRNVQEIYEQLTPAIEDVLKKSVERKASFRSIAIIGILTDLSIKTRNNTLEMPTNDSSTLRKAVFVLLGELLNDFDKKLRRVGVRVSGFTSLADQGSLLEYMKP
jgi:DNA polymerase IV (DinB-like DNA polymerase)